MIIKVITAPTSEPITLAEAKAQCRVDGTDEDTLITSLIGAARQYTTRTPGHVDAHLGRTHNRG